MAKSKKDSADTQLALQVFENFQVDTIQANIPIIQQLKIDKKHPLYNQLQGKALKKDFQRQELSSILEKRKFRRPKKLSRAELQGKQGFLLDAQSLANAQRVLELCPEINFIPSKKPLNEVLSEESLKKLPEHLKKTSFEKNIIKDNSNNIYAISESALGKGAFGEVLIGQAIHVPAASTDLKIGNFVAVKKQVVSEDNPVEDLEKEFGFEKKLPNYHFGSALQGQNVFSFIKLIRGSELGDWVGKNVLHSETINTQDTVLSQYEQAMMLHLYDPTHYEVMRLTEQQGLEELVLFEKELDDTIEKINEIFDEHEKLKDEIFQENKKIIDEASKDEELKDLSEEEYEEKVIERLEKMEKEKMFPLLEKLNDLGWVDWLDPSEGSPEQGRILNDFEERFNNFTKKRLEEAVIAKFPGTKIEDCPEYGDLTILKEKIEVLRSKLFGQVIYKPMNIGKDIDELFHPLGTFKRAIKPSEEGIFKPNKELDTKKVEYDEEAITVDTATDIFPKEIELEKFLQVSLTTAERLKALHQDGILHRDLKPANLLIDTEKEEVTIVDFGVSQMLDEDKKVVSGAGGTPAYWAPEIYNNIESSNILQTPATDMWSLGATFEQLSLPVLEKILSTNDFKKITHDVREGPGEVERMLPLILNNPNNDPHIHALNRYFEIIINLKKIDPANRKDINYVIKELNEAINQLRIEKQRKNDLYQALSHNTSFNENSAHDLLEAKTAINNWQRNNPKKALLKASEVEIKSCIAQIIQKRKQDKIEAETKASHEEAKHEIFTDRAQKDYEHNKQVLEDLKEEIVYIASSPERIPPEIQILSESIEKVNKKSKENREQVNELEKQIRELKYKNVIKKDPSENQPSPEDKEALIAKLKEQVQQITEAEKINKKELNELTSRKAALLSELDRAPLILANKEAHLLQVQKAIMRYENRDVPTPDEIADKKQDSTSSKRESPEDKRKEPIIKRQKIEKQTSFTSNDVLANERATIPIKPHVPVTSSKPTKSPEQLALLSWFQNQDIQKLYSSQKVSKRIPFANLSIFQLDARKDQIKNLQNIVNNVAEMLNKDVHSPEALSSVMEGFLEEVRKMHQQVANEKNSRMLGDSKMEKMLENMKTEVQGIVRDLGQLNQPKKDTPYSP